MPWLRALLHTTTSPFFSALFVVSYSFLATLSDLHSPFPIDQLIIDLPRICIR